MYAMIIDNMLHPAPRHLFIGDIQVFNPTHEQYADMGYKPVRLTNMPDAPEGYYNEVGWQDTGDEIVQTWATLIIPTDE